MPYHIACFDGEEQIDRKAHRYHLENLWRRIETKTKYNDTYLRGDKMPKNDKAE